MNLTKDWNKSYIFFFFLFLGKLHSLLVSLEPIPSPSTPFLWGEEVLLVLELIGRMPETNSSNFFIIEDEYIFTFSQDVLVELQKCYLTIWASQLKSILQT